MCIVSLWQDQAYIEGAKWEAVAGQWTQWPEELMKQLVCKFSVYYIYFNT